MKGVYVSHTNTQRGRATGMDLVINVNGEQKTKFIASFGDSKKVYDILREGKLQAGQGIDLKMTKVSRNGQDFWNPSDLVLMEAAPAGGSQSSSGGGMGGFPAPKSSDEGLRTQCMNMAVTMLTDKKGATPEAVLDMAATFYNDIKAEVFGVSANFVPDLDAIANDGMNNDGNFPE